MSRRSLRSAGRGLGLLAALALTLPAALSTAPAGAEESAPRADTVSPLTLWAPARIVTYAYGKRVWTDLGLRVIAQGDPFELWSTRPSYDALIQTEWRSPGGTVALPDGVMSDFSGLEKFLRISVQRVGSTEVQKFARKACLNSWSERVDPDAPATSPYPRGCWYNPYSLGSVQGVQAGWAAPVMAQDRPLRLAPGKYDVTARIAKSYTDLFGISDADASRTVRLVVKRQDPGPMYRPAPHSDPQSSTAQPAAHEPRGTSGGRIAGPVPDLRSLPAWGIRVSENGNFLQFSATVWNGGDSPLVVDGFRNESQDEMDAYQYFFDADGNQTGYQSVGHMHWDTRPTHQHWHFKDFASYELLNADQTRAVKSRKEAFCLANTDSVDTTVPNATWNPENTDLSTSCGGYGSLSIREVLASGWGDTYAQFRAGQSFDLRGLPNGTYYVAVIANPKHRLVEASTDNNVALRKVIIRGTEGKRTVRVPQVGIVQEPDYSGGVVPVD